jgi:ankyrin repeat protein
VSLSVPEAGLVIRSNPSYGIRKDVNAKDDRGKTPLHIAVTRKDVATSLLANNADVNARDNLGMTPLHLTAQLGRKEMAELLLTSGADVNAKANDGSTPLLWAAAYNQGVAKVLRQHGGHE